MEIVLLGFGKMGKLIKGIAVERGHSIISVDPFAEGADYHSLAKLPAKGDTLAIDFSHPDVVLDNMRTAIESGINLVVGTTGWLENLSEVKKLVDRAGTGFLHASNFSLGVYLFSIALRQTARLFSRFDSYDVAGVEWHHSGKADSPSGTALSLAKIVQEETPAKSKLVTDRLDRKPEGNEFHFASVRCGSIPGTHEIVFDSKADTISLKHTARSREGFALGAVLAAEWLKGRQGFFTIDDMMEDLTAE